MVCGVVGEGSAGAAGTADCPAKGWTNGSGAPVFGGIGGGTEGEAAAGDAATGGLSPGVNWLAGSPVALVAAAMDEEGDLTTAAATATPIAARTPIASTTRVRRLNRRAPTSPPRALRWCPGRRACTSRVGPGSGC